MTDKAELERIADHFRKLDRFARHVGIEIVEIKPGWAKTRLKIADHHLNGVGIVQGGAVFTLADLAFAAASNSYGTVAVALNVSISYLKATSGGELIAIAEENTKSRRVGSYTVRVTNDAGDLVAMFQGVVFRKDEPIPFED